MDPIPLVASIIVRAVQGLAAGRDAEVKLPEYPEGRRLWRYRDLPIRCMRYR